MPLGKMYKASGAKAVAVVPVRPKRALNSRQRKQVKNIINGLAEKKFHPQLLTFRAAYDISAQILNDPAQGDGDLTRDGDEMRGRSLMIRGSVYWDSSANRGEGCRIVVVCFKNGNQNATGTSIASFQPSDIMALGGTSDVLISHYREDTRDRFQVLYDRTFSCPSANSTWYPKIFFKANIPLKNKLTQFDAGTTRITKNAIAVYVFGEDLATNSNGAVVDWYSKYTYTDM